MTYRFFVDGKQYESPEQILTPTLLREIAHILPKMRIFIGHAGDGTADRQMRHDLTVDLLLPSDQRFYTLAPPSMDIN